MCMVYVKEGLKYLRGIYDYYDRILNKYLFKHLIPTASIVRLSDLDKACVFSFYLKQRMDEKLCVKTGFLSISPTVEN